MNVFTRTTIKTLKKNRTRTLVTIIGIILATAMADGGDCLYFQPAELYAAGGD